MSAGEGTLAFTHGARNGTIDSKHTVLFRLPNGEVRSIKVEKDS